MNEEQYRLCLDKIKQQSYPTQDHWNIFSEKYYKKISNFDCMCDFRINGISNMLETGLPSQDREQLIASKDQKYNIDYNENEIQELKKRFEELTIMMGDDIQNIQFNSTVGNPRRFNYIYKNTNYSLNFDDLYHVYATWQLKRLINTITRPNKVNTVLEIGAGYGNLPHKLKSIFPSVKYTIIDLPEVLLIQHYYLSKNNPSYKIVNLLDHEELTYGDVNQIDCDILLIPFSLYHDLQINFDLVINNRSFGEMSYETLRSYIEWIQNNINPNGFLYTVNRYVFTKSIDQNKIREYPFDNSWKVIISQPQWLQTHLHEFFIQRTEDSAIPINFLLQSFPISTPPCGPIMEKIQTQSEWIKHQKVQQ